MKKMDNRWLAFDDKWFKKHQNTILFILNSLIFRIFNKNIAFYSKNNEKINKIGPNYIVFSNCSKKRAKFYTHWKFSKLFYYKFKYLWHFMHFLDEIWLDKQNLIPNFGFATLTVYPDADPETTSMDAVLRKAGASGSSAATAWNGVATSTPANNANASNATGDFVRSKMNYNGSVWVCEVTRGFFLFDTSSLGGGEILDSGSMSLYVTSTVNEDNDGGDYICLYSCNPASNTAIATSDYNTVGSTEYSSQLDIGSISTAAYNALDLNPTGLSVINQTGITKFAVREGHDVTNTPIAASAGQDNENTVSGYYADQTGTTNDPVLEVIYGLGGGSSFRSSGGGVSSEPYHF